MRCNFSVTAHPLKPVKQFQKGIFLSLLYNFEDSIVLQLIVVVILFVLYDTYIRSIPFISVSLDRFLRGAGFDFIFYFRAVERAGGSRYLLGRHIFAVVDRHVFAILPILLRVDLNGCIIEIHIVAIIGRSVRYTRIVNDCFGSSQIRLDSRHERRI